VDVLLVLVSAAALLTSGTVMVLRIAGVGRGAGWPAWAPFVFGLSIVVGTAAFVHLLVSGIR
jgi:hypothetical protein